MGLRPPDSLGEAHNASAITRRFSVKLGRAGIFVPKRGSPMVTFISILSYHRQS